MISLSSSLVEAMRSREGAPCVRAVVMDRRRRWSTILKTECSKAQTAAVEMTGGVVLRARATAAGGIEVQTVAEPGTAASWESSWSEVADDALPSTDVALARRAGAGDVRLFYIQLHGDTYRLRCVTSGDCGASWGAPADVCSSVEAIGSLAAAGTVVLYVRDGRVRRRWKPWTGGVWGSEATWTGCGHLSEDRGLAAVLEGGVYFVTVAGKWGEDRRLRTGTYSGVEGWSTEVTDVVPPGLPAADYCPEWPSLVLVDGVKHLGYMDSYLGTPSYAMQVVMSTTDWDHWGCACGLDLGWETKKRANLVYSSTEQSLYAAMEADVVASRSYDAGDPGQRMVEGDVLFYQMNVGEGYGYMLVDVFNPAGKYDEFGRADKAGEAIKMLSEVVMERGYRTSAGAEYVAGSRFYVVKASHRVGVGRPALRLVCVDGWGLMGRWEADQSYRWVGKSVRWLITELVSRSCQLVCGFDGSTEWDLEIDEFALHPVGWTLAKSRESSEGGEGIPVVSWTGTAVRAVNALLKKVGGRAFWDQEGRLQCIVPSNQSVVDWHEYGENQEIIKAEYGTALVAPNVLRVMGQATGWQAGHLMQGQELGCRLMGIAVDLHLDQCHECQKMVNGMWDRAAAAEYGGWLEVHLNPGQELWDFVSVTDGRCGYSSELRRVASICEVWNSAARRYSSILRIEGT